VAIVTTVLLNNAPVTDWVKHVGSVAPVIGKWRDVGEQQRRMPQTLFAVKPSKSATTESRELMLRREDRTE
jgi:hypothetical protein